MQEKDFYGALGIGVGASPDEIKKAYRTIARINHPDINPDPEAHEKMKAATEAYDVLSDPQKKDFYDLSQGSGYKSNTRPNNPRSQSRQASETKPLKKKNERNRNISFGGLAGTVLFASAGVNLVENNPIAGSILFGVGAASAGVLYWAFSKEEKARRKR